MRMSLDNVHLIFCRRYMLLFQRHENQHLLYHHQEHGHFKDDPKYFWIIIIQGKTATIIKHSDYYSIISVINIWRCVLPNTDHQEIMMAYMFTTIITFS